MGFNPHPARRPGATPVEEGVRGRGQDVSILTRPEGRVLPPGCGPFCGGCVTFQSSPGPKAGCYKTFEWPSQAAAEFQSSPGPKAGCYNPALYSESGAH